MKNLENYGVQVLDAREIRETDGGGWIPVVGGIARLLQVIVGLDELIDMYVEPMTPEYIDGEAGLGGSGNLA